MRQLISIFLMVFLCSGAKAQSLGTQLLGSAGAKGESQGISLSWSVGETMIGTALSGQYALTQGFHQPQTMETQVIPLPQHWCYFSSYIDKDGQNIALVTNEILPHLRLIKNNYGEVYIPQFTVNQIGSFQVTEAYQANLSEADTLVLRGFSVLPEQTPVSLNSGWNLLTYLRHETAPVSQLMQPLGNALQMLKTYTGNIYWPAFSFNNVYNLQPGRGYSVKMNGQANFYYPSNATVFAKNAATESLCRHFPAPERSGQNMTLAIPLDVWDAVPETGDEIGIFNPKGEIVGAQVFQSGNMAISLWGSDEYSPVGLEENQAFVLKLAKAANGQETELVVENWAEGDGLYRSHSLSIVGKMKRQLPDYGLQIGPNPARDFLNLRFGSEAGEGKIQVYDANGKCLLIQSFTGNEDEEQSLRLGLPGLAPGQYWLSIQTGSREMKATFTIIQ